MKSLSKHTVEYYQNNKFLGSIVKDGEVPQEKVGYYGMEKVTEGEIRLKRIHKASAERPIEVVRYNLQGR